MSRALAATIGLAGLLAACSDEAGPRTQALVHLDTDAHLPRMMDRLRLQTYVERAGALEPQCEGCAREIALSEEAWPISFGVLPEPGARVLVRATLFLTGRAGPEGPAAETAIDAIAEVRFEDGRVLDQLLFLPMDCTGAPVDLVARTVCRDASARAAAFGTTAPYDASAPSRAGTWHAELIRDCAGAPQPETGLFDEDVCIPGGIYWMGDIRRQGFGPSLDAVPEHAVAVAPFYLDRYEYSVGRFRRLVDELGFVPRLNDPVYRSDAATYCNAYSGPRDPDRDSRPLNCVTAWEAQRICAAEGRRLPTEAEWEWAGGGRENEGLYPWGHHEPDTFCWIGSWYRADCPAGAPDWGTNGAPVDAHPLGATPDGILDMSGNVAEWLADAWHLYTEPCWLPGAYGPSPFCDPAVVETSHGRATRGGAFGESGPYRYMVTSRGGSFPNERSATGGFRCAR